VVRWNPQAVCRHSQDHNTPRHARFVELGHRVLCLPPTPGSCKRGSSSSSRNWLWCRSGFRSLRYARFVALLFKVPFSMTDTWVRTIKSVNQPLDANHDEGRFAHPVWPHRCHLPQSTSHLWQRSFRAQRRSDHNHDLDGRNSLGSVRDICSHSLDCTRSIGDWHRSPYW
jgi:hypothetical protein